MALKTCRTLKILEENIEYVFVSYPPLTREYSQMFKANSETLKGEMFSLGETLS